VDTEFLFVKISGTFSYISIPVVKVWV